MGEERGFDSLPIILGGIGAELDPPERAPVASRPAAVIPRAGDEKAHLPAVEGLEGFVDLLRPVEILLVPPSGHMKRRDRDPGEVRGRRLLLPEGVVVRVGDIIVPGRNLPEEVLLVDVRERAEPQVPFVGVVAVEVERGVLLGRLHPRGVLETVAQPEGPVVVEVIAEVHIRGRGLRRHGLDRRMGLEHGHGREPSAVRYAQQAGPPVVTADIFEKPGDRVVGIRALVDRSGIALVARRPHHDERPLGLVAPADILIDEDVTVVDEGPIAFQGERARIRRRAVGRAKNQKGQGPCGLVRREDDGVELHPVPHGNHRPELGERGRSGGNPAGRRIRGEGRERDDDGRAGEDRSFFQDRFFHDDRSPRKLVRWYHRRFTGFKWLSVRDSRGRSEHRRGPRALPAG